MLLNSVLGEDYLRIPCTARRSNQCILNEISPEYLLEGVKLNWSSHTLATWCKELNHWKRPWWWERLKAGKEGDDRGWDGWMASLTWWTWVWVSYGSWWWTGRPGVLQFMGSPRVGHNWVTELNWKICPTRFPGAQSASLHSELPQGGVEGQQLQQHRVQSSRR